MLIPGSGAHSRGYYPYNIANSIICNDDDSASFSRTPGSASDRKTWTFSTWVKRSNLTVGVLFGAGSTASDYEYLRLESGDSLRYVRVVSSAVDADKTSTNLFRDTAGFYHILLSVDAVSGTASIYVNGTEVTYSVNDNPSNVNGSFNNNVVHYIGTGHSGIYQSFFDGYLAETIFIDGQALTPSSFGETNADGIWVPKKYTGSYGTNGFNLDYEDNTSATTLGYDVSGNGNHWTPSGITTTDQTIDTPTNNFPVFNSIDRDTEILNLREGSTEIFAGNYSSDNFGAAACTFSLPKSGKWYFEANCKELAGTGNSAVIGIVAPDQNWNTLGALYSVSTFDGVHANLSGNAVDSVDNGSSTSRETSIAGDMLIMIAIDVDAGKMWTGRAGTWHNSGDPAAGTGNVATGTYTDDHLIAGMVAVDGGSTNKSAIEVDFGQKGFTYTPPAGFNSLCSNNLPTPDISKGSEYFNTVLYTGSGTSNPVTGVGFSPSLVWNKNRSGAYSHNLSDSVRGVNLGLTSNGQNAEYAIDLDSFDTDGFTVSGTTNQMNATSNNYVAWCWNEAPIAGFDIVSYTGNGTNRTIAHSLGVTPELMIVKNRDLGTASWPSYHKDMDATPQNGALWFNLNNAYAASATVWNNTAPTASVFSVGTADVSNQNTANMIAYLFVSIEGYSKIGKYTGNGSTDGSFINCGFRPRWVMVKREDSAGDWVIFDTVRGTYNLNDSRLIGSLSIAEDVSTFGDMLSNGFKIRAPSTTGNLNATGGSYVYAAFAENPFKYANAR